MQISLKPGTTRKDDFYAIKLRGNGAYLGGRWRIVNGVEICTYHWITTKVARVAKGGTIARTRLLAMIDHIESDLKLVMSNPPSRWRTNNIDELSSLLNNGFDLVEIKFELNSTETVV